MTPEDTPAARASALLRDRLGLRGSDLGRQLRKAGRRLPRRIRQDGETLAMARLYAGHPKMARRLDAATLARAEDRLTRHLSAINPREARRTRMINIAALLALQILLLGIGIVAFLVWRGIV